MEAFCGGSVGVGTAVTSVMSVPHEIVRPGLSPTALLANGRRSPRNDLQLGPAVDATLVLVPARCVPRQPRDDEHDNEEGEQRKNQCAHDLHLLLDATDDRSQRTVPKVLCPWPTTPSRGPGSDNSWAQEPPGVEATRTGRLSPIAARPASTPMPSPQGGDGDEHDQCDSGERLLAHKMR